MIYSINTRVSQQERYLVLSIICLFVLVSAFASLISKIQGPVIPGFVVVCGISVFIISLQTAFLLYTQSNLELNKSVAFLASGYFLISFLALYRIIFIPNAILPSYLVSEESQISSWMWTIWHIIFPIYIILYSLNFSFGQKISYKAYRWYFRLVPLISVVIILSVIFGEHLLPHIINGNNYSQSLYLDKIILIFSIGALFSLILKKGTYHRQDLWLLLATVTHSLDVFYGIVGEVRYSIGWYLGTINGLISSTIILGVFIHRIKKIAQTMKEENYRLRDMTETDVLTGIANRRKFNLIFKTLWTLALQQEKSICLIMIDIDHFKLYNDTLGHLEGDKCLMTVAQTLKTIAKRQIDLTARIGGEEFVILLFGVNEKEGLKYSEEARKAIENLKMPTPSTLHPYVTVSVGWGVITPDTTINPDWFIDKVDKALYQAKNKGRNTTVGID